MQEQEANQGAIFRVAGVESWNVLDGFGKFTTQNNTKVLRLCTRCYEFMHGSIFTHAGMAK